MKTSFLFILLALTSSLFAQKSLRDSLFGGKMRVPDSVLKAANLPDSNKASTNGDIKTEANGSPSTGIKTETGVLRTTDTQLGDAMPDSLNRSFYSKQKIFK